MHKKYLQTLVMMTILILSLPTQSWAPPQGRPPEYDPFTERLPAQKGVYRVFDRNGICRYVGSSNDVDKRVTAHVRTGTIRRGDIVSVTTFHGNTGQNTVADYEVREISRLNPTENIHPGGPGRPWGH